MVSTEDINNRDLTEDQKHRLAASMELFLLASKSLTSKAAERYAERIQIFVIEGTWEAAWRNGK